MKQLVRAIFLLVPVFLIVAALLTYTPFLHASTSLNMSAKGYIVTLKESATPNDVSALKSKIAEWGGEITHTYDLIKGFAVKLPEIHSQLLTSESHVAAVEPDSEVKIN